MGLFSRRKKDDDIRGVSIRPSKDFDINDIDLPPLPGEENHDLEFSKNLPRNEDLPPLPEPPRPKNLPYDLPQKYPPQKVTPTIQPPRPEYSAPRPISTPKINAPVFVKIDKYREVVNTITSIKRDLEELNRSLDALKESKMKEDEIIAGWTGILSQVASKLEKINSGLFSPEE